MPEQAATRRPSARPAWADALAGLVAGAAGLGLAELVAGIIPGAPSPVTSIGGLVIALQPPGAKQLVADLFSTNDKLVLNVVVAIVALGLAAAIGLLARRSLPLARWAFVGLGVLVLVAALRDPLVDRVLAVVSAVLAVGVATWTLGRLIPGQTASVQTEPMPDFGRRRFLGTSLAIAGAAAVGGLAGRVLLERRETAALEVTPVPAASRPVPSLPPATALDVPGITPIVVPNADFYRIDTALLVPRPDATTWSLTVDGMVDRPFSVGYEELLEMPLFEQYVTIACVSNEVGGHLVGNALWRGVRLRSLLDRAGVQEGATQVASFSVDGWSSGFPTAWLDAPDREAMVAVAMNGAPLPPEHGFPARLIVPGLFGYVSATKWLKEIRLTTLEAFDGYWVPLGWAKEAPILTQSRIDVPRSGSTVGPGAVAVAGVAWAPDRGIRAVEVQVDGGAWMPAELSAPISDATWVQWLYRWDASPGNHRISVRATDGTGEVQTDAVTEPPPDGARGHHTISLQVG